MTSTPTTSSSVVSYVPGAQIKAALTNHSYTIPSSPLAGADLIEFTKLYPHHFPSKTDLVAASGHVRNNGKVAFVSFYEALLAAKLEADPHYHVTIDAARDEDKEYDELSLPLQELYDEIHSRFGEKWDHMMILDFLQELSDLGINSVSSLNDAFYAVVDDNCSWEKDFAEEYVNKIEDLSDSLIYHAIDWQSVWDHQLTYDFYTIEFDSQVYVFYSNF